MNHHVLAVAVLATIFDSVGWAEETLQRENADSYDLVVYGGTSAGVAAAVQATRMGKSAVLIEPGQHLGGLTSGGLGATDIGNKAAIGGIAREFYGRVFNHYADDAAWKWQSRADYRGAHRLSGEHTILTSNEAKKLPRRLDKDTMWTFEPHVAEAILHRMTTEAGVQVHFDEQLNRQTGVYKDGQRIAAIEMESGRSFRGHMFVDATYEGDLLAAAGVSYTIGREANSAYGETLNGVQTALAKYHQFLLPIDPYVRPGEPASGLLWGIQPEPPGPDGSADSHVQAYCLRMCQTDAPDNRVAWQKPAAYDPARYELLLRNLESGDAYLPLSVTGMPNRKSDTNNNRGFSTDFIGENYAWPEADYATRERIYLDHKHYQMGLMWTLANHPRIPESIRESVSRWGLAGDEFVDTDHWPHQLYIREARRMVGSYVMTQHHCQGRAVVGDPVGMAAYGMDSHNVHRYAKGGRVWNEGDVQVRVKQPYPVSYRSIVPKRGQCENLLVPVCVSASHIAYGSIRMEPVFMVLGQSAATAACLAVDADTVVQDVPYAALRSRLLADRQVLAWTPAARRVPIDPRALSGLVADNRDKSAFSSAGHWTASTSANQYVGTEYLHDGNAEKGKKRVIFTLKSPKAGRYRVLFGFPPGGNRARSVPVAISWGGNSKRVTVDQRVAGDPKQPKYRWDSLAEITLGDASTCRVEVQNGDTDGYVIVDAVRIEPIE